jgi:hypothetical protein
MKVLDESPTDRLCTSESRGEVMVSDSGKNCSKNVEAATVVLRRGRPRFWCIVILSGDIDPCAPSSTAGNEIAPTALVVDAAASLPIAGNAAECFLNGDVATLVGVMAVVVLTDAIGMELGDDRTSYPML